MAAHPFQPFSFGDSDELSKSDSQKSQTPAGAHRPIRFRENLLGALARQRHRRTHPRGNSYTAWAEVTPRHNAFVEALLQSPLHILVTMRSKQDFVLTDRNG